MATFYGESVWQRAWTALLSAVLLAQCVLVQAHVHVAAPATAMASAAEHAETSVPSNPSRGDAAEHCFLCLEAATSGHYTAPPAPVLPLLSTAMLWGAPPALAVWLLRRPPLGWFGRAPPK